MRIKGWARCARRMLTAFGGLFLSIGSASLAQGASLPPNLLPAPARPALWVVNDQDTIIYLFGTIHTHDGRTPWFDHAIRRAFDASGTLVLETVVPPSAPSGAAAPATGGLAAARATVSTARTMGMSVELGADQVLSRVAHLVGKPVIGLERFDQQLDMYRALPSSAKPSAATGAASTAAPDAALAPFLRGMVDGWNRGDPGIITAVVEQVRQQSPESYKRLFVDRNADWARWIEARLAQPGVVFVAVGTGHLVGADSVQAQLAAAGVKSARIN